MDRRRFLLTSLAGMVAAPIVVEAQQRAADVRRIGYLSSNSASLTHHLSESFRQGLHALGWIEGRNVQLHYRFADAALERLPKLAAELAELNVDVIVAAPSSAAVAAKKATTTIPIVMVNVGEPVSLGLVASLARPGGNVTGLSYSPGLEIVAKAWNCSKK